jgi:hypothetical protein
MSRRPAGSSGVPGSAGTAALKRSACGLAGDRFGVAAVGGDARSCQQWAPELRASAGCWIDGRYLAGVGAW